MNPFKKVVLAGGSGYLGTVLATYFAPISDEVILLSRRAAATRNNIRTIVWDAKTGDDWAPALAEADLLVNLCGKNVNCRYTPENKAEIIRSRVEPTRLLAATIQQLSLPPKLWINITSATIYRHAEDRPQDEEQGETGYGFSIDVCRQWEATFFESALQHTRRIALRMAIVFGRNDGVFPRLLNLVRCGLGGHQGNGHQYVSWIHEQDAARSIEWLTRCPDISGVINCAAPVAIKNKDLMTLIRKTYGMPFGLPSPEWLLNAGAALIGTETELILKSRWVAPKRLLDNDFAFQYGEPGAAIHDILSIRT